MYTSAIIIGMKANGVKRREFTFITAGVINRRIFKMGIYTKIK